MLRTFRQLCQVITRPYQANHYQLCRKQVSNSKQPLCQAQYQGSVLQPRCMYSSHRERRRCLCHLLQRIRRGQPNERPLRLITRRNKRKSQPSSRPLTYQVRRRNIRRGMGSYPSFRGEGQPSFTSLQKEQTNQFFHRAQKRRSHRPLSSPGQFYIRATLTTRDDRKAAAREDRRGVARAFEKANRAAPIPLCAHGRRLNAGALKGLFGRETRRPLALSSSSTAAAFKLHAIA